MGADITAANIDRTCSVAGAEIRLLLRAAIEF
jgi:hypothetical protein